MRIRHLLTLQLSKKFLQDSVDPLSCKLASCNLKVVDVDGHKQLEHLPAIDVGVPEQKVVVEHAADSVGGLFKEEDESQLEHEWSVGKPIHCPKANERPKSSVTVRDLHARRCLFIALK